MSVSPIAPLSTMKFGSLPAVKEYSKLSDIASIKQSTKKKKTNSRQESMIQLLRQEVNMASSLHEKKRVRKGSSDAGILENESNRSEVISSMSTSRTKSRRPSFSLTQRRRSSLTIDSPLEMYQMTDCERKRFEMLQTLDKMSIQSPKRQRKMTITEVNMYEKLLLQKRRSLTTRMIEATTSRRYRRTPSQERSTQLTPVDIKLLTPELSEEQHEKLKYTPVLMSKANTDNKPLKSESPVSQPFTRSRNVSLTGSDHGGDGLNMIRRRFRRKKKTGNRFKRLAKFLVVLLRSWRIHSQNVNEILGNFDHLDAVTKHGGPEDLWFDITEYKAAKQAKVSKETNRILSKKPGTRTEEEIYYILIALRNYKSIAEYPVKMQQMLAERGWIETYNSKRVIIREGHIPACFYFVLTGSAVVSALDSKSQKAKTILFLNRGDSFGEQAIMTRSLRQTTVITRETVELLAIRDTDFVDIFMSGGLRDSNDSFIRSITFLREWPIEKLARNPKKAMISFFKRGTILVDDSSDNDWLFVVKSGSCSVLKKLHHINPKRFVNKTEKMLWREKVEKTLKNDTIMSHEEQISVLRNEEIKKLEQKNVQLRYFSLPEINIATNAVYAELRDLYHKHMNKNEINRAIGALHTATGFEEDTESIITEEESKYKGQARVIRKKSLASLSTLIGKGPFLNKTKLPSAVTERPYPLSETIHPDYECGETGKHVTIHSTVTTPEKESNPGPTGKPPIYLEVKILTKGMVFGLTDLIFDGQPVLSLVSNGVEVIMVNKKFFMEYMSNNQIVRLRAKTRPYPSEEDLTRKLERQLGWDHHKKVTVNNTVRDIKIRKSDLNDARSLLTIPPERK